MSFHDSSNRSQGGSYDDRKRESTDLDIELPALNHAHSSAPLFYFPDSYYDASTLFKMDLERINGFRVLLDGKLIGYQTSMNALEKGKVVDACFRGGMDHDTVEEVKEFIKGVDPKFAISVVDAYACVFEALEGYQAEMKRCCAFCRRRKIQEETEDRIRSYFERLQYEIKNNLPKTISVQI